MSVEVNYIYKARIIDIVDGDTVHADVDTGFDQWTKKTLRLYGINAPEMSTPEGQAAKDYISSMIKSGSEVLIQTVKDHREKYGRYLATIYVDGVSVNALMVASGHASYYLP